VQRQLRRRAVGAPLGRARAAAGRWLEAQRGAACAGAGGRGAVRLGALVLQRGAGRRLTPAHRRSSPSPRLTPRSPADGSRADPVPDATGRVRGGPCSLKPAAREGGEGPKRRPRALAFVQSGTVRRARRAGCGRWPST